MWDCHRFPYPCPSPCSCCRWLQAGLRARGRPAKGASCCLRMHGTMRNPVSTHEQPGGTCPAGRWLTLLWYAAGLPGAAVSAACAADQSLGLSLESAAAAWIAAAHPGCRATGVGRSSLGGRIAHLGLALLVKRPLGATCGALQLRRLCIALGRPCSALHAHPYGMIS